MRRNPVLAALSEAAGIRGYRPRQPSQRLLRQPLRQRGLLEDEPGAKLRRGCGATRAGRAGRVGGVPATGAGAGASGCHPAARGAEHGTARRPRLCDRVAQRRVAWAHVAQPDVASAALGERRTALAARQRPATRHHLRARASAPPGQIWRALGAPNRGDALCWAAAPGSGSAECRAELPAGLPARRWRGRWQGPHPSGDHSGRLAPGAAKGPVDHGFSRPAR